MLLSAAPRHNKFIHKYNVKWHFLSPDLLVFVIQFFAGRSGNNCEKKLNSREAVKIKKKETNKFQWRSVNASLPRGETSLKRFSNFASSFVSKALMAEQTLVSSQISDSVPFIATRTSKFKLKQVANNKRIFRTKEKKVRFRGGRVLSATDWLRFPV